MHRRIEFHVCSVSIMRAARLLFSETKPPEVKISIQLCMYASARTRAQTRFHSITRAQRRARAHAGRLHTRARARTHTHTHTHTHTRTHARTQMYSRCILMPAVCSGPVGFILKWFNLITPQEEEGKGGRSASPMPAGKSVPCAAPAPSVLGHARKQPEYRMRFPTSATCRLVPPKGWH